jgi:hypothetical protein
MQNLNQSISSTDTCEVPDHTDNTNNACIDNATLGRTLEHLIDTVSLNRVTMMIASVCTGRASHIRHTSVDEHLALAWEFNAREFKKLSKHAQLTNPTIQVCSSQLGIEPSELQWRIAELPEPLRVIAMDYFHGALPPVGRSNAMRCILRDIKDRIKGGEDDIEARRRAA